MYVLYVCMYICIHVGISYQILKHTQANTYEYICTFTIPAMIEPTESLNITLPLLASRASNYA